MTEKIKKEFNRNLCFKCMTSISSLFVNKQVWQRVSSVVVLYYLTNLGRKKMAVYLSIGFAHKLNNHTKFNQLSKFIQQYYFFNVEECMSLN